MQLCDSVKPTQSKIVFILDGKRVPMDTIIKKMQLNEIEGGEGVADDFPKRAIQLFGEKYRNGLIFFETIKKENNEK
jgi:hypothetical protein